MAKQYRLKLDNVRQYAIANGKKTVNGTTYDARTPDKLIDVLETLRDRRQLCRVFYGHEDGKSWHEENDCYGYIGRSTGSIKIPLMVHPNSHGGPPLLDHCIVGVKVRDGKGKTSWLYKHDKLDLGAWRAVAIAETSELYAAGYRTTVLCNEEMHANFKGSNSLAKADRYIDFMTGNRLVR